MDYFFIGNEELVTAFRLIGIHGIAVKDSTEAVTVFRKITEDPQIYNSADEYAASVAEQDKLPASAETCRILILTEETAEWLGDYVINWQLSGHYPLIVEIPGIEGRHEGRKTLMDSIREAIGIHV